MVRLVPLAFVALAACVLRLASAVRGSDAACTESIELNVPLLLPASKSGAPRFMCAAIPELHLADMVVVRAAAVRLASERNGTAPAAPSGYIYVSMHHAEPNASAHDWRLAWPGPPHAREPSLSYAAQVLFVSLSSSPPLDPRMRALFISLFALGEVALEVERLRLSIVPDAAGRVAVATRPAAGRATALQALWMPPLNTGQDQYTATLFVRPAPDASAGLGEQLAALAAVMDARQARNATALGPRGKLVCSTSEGGQCSQLFGPRPEPGLYAVNVVLSSLVDGHETALAAQLLAVPSLAPGPAQRRLAASVAPTLFVLAVIGALCAVRLCEPHGPSLLPCWRWLAARRARAARAAWPMPPAPLASRRVRMQAGYAFVPSCAVGGAAAGAVFRETGETGEAGEADSGDEHD